MLLLLLFLFCFVVVVVVVVVVVQLSTCSSYVHWSISSTCIPKTVQDETLQTFITVNIV